MKILYKIVAIILILIFSSYFTCQYFYYKEFNSIRNEFSKIEEIEKFNLQIGNFDIEIEEISANINFKEGTFIRFNEVLYPSSFYDTSFVRIRKFNEWCFETNSFRKSNKDYYILSSLSFGKEGQLNKYIKKEIMNMRQAIEKRLDIQTLVEKIPIYPEMAMIEHKDWNSRETITFISKYLEKDEPYWEHDKFEGKFDSLMLNAIVLKPEK